MRKKAGMTQAKLAELMEKDTSTVNRWERGMMEFSVGDLVKMADILNCAPGDLIEDGDGLVQHERDLIAFLRAHPQDARILLTTYQAMRDAREDDAA